MGDPAGFEHSVLARIDEVVGQAVAEGQAPGVVAAVARGDTVHVVTAGAMGSAGRRCIDDGRHTWEGGFGTVWSIGPLQDLTVVVLTQRAADETGMPAVCDDVLAAARGTR
jgi:hypothetical protein